MPAEVPMPVVRGSAKYEEAESPLLFRAGALRSFARVSIGEVAMLRFWPIARDEVFTVLQGRLGRPTQPSDSDDDRREPEPDFPSNAVSLMC